jgi:hypothetical protein
MHKFFLVIIPYIHSFTHLEYYIDMHKFFLVVIPYIHSFTHLEYYIDMHKFFLVINPYIHSFTHLEYYIDMHKFFLVIIPYIHSFTHLEYYIDMHKFFLVIIPYIRSFTHLEHYIDMNIQFGVWFKEKWTYSTFPLTILTLLMLCPCFYLQNVTLLNVSKHMYNFKNLMFAFQLGLHAYILTKSPCLLKCLQLLIL